MGEGSAGIGRGRRYRLDRANNKAVKADEMIVG